MAGVMHCAAMTPFADNAILLGQFPVCAAGKLKCQASGRCRRSVLA